MLLALLWIGYAVVAILAALDVPGVPLAGMTRVFAGLDLADEASLFLATIAAVTAMGLLLSRSWGWVLAMMTVGVSLAFDVVGWMNGREAYPYLAIGVAIVFYLNQGEVRRRFFAQTDPAPHSVTLADGERDER
jgi:uncharacterized membrane protein (DUF2068 family)